ncbi:MAG: hypothetical protein AAF514_12185 [Verrucomicrobiota bacterium]
MIISLLLPVLLTGIALFFASFLFWVVTPIHKADWPKLPDEDAFIKAIRPLDLPLGNYMYPGYETMEEAKREEHQNKWKNGPRGVLTVLPKPNMGRNLGLTFVFFLLSSFCIAYLASLALPSGTEFARVFRVVATAAIMTYLPAILLHAIWFRCRVVGHVVETIAYAAICGAIFGALWPGA